MAEIIIYIKKLNTIKWPIALIAAFLLLFVADTALAQQIAVPRIDIGVETANSPKEVSVSIQILLLLTVLTLAPSLLIMITSFTRIIIVLSFIRNALGLQQIPPTPVLIGLALFLSFFVMAPTFAKINKEAYQPYVNGKITQKVALSRAEKPMRQFMFKQTQEKDLALFVHLSKMKQPKNQDEIPIHVLIPAFIIGELKKAFLIGFLIYIPFLIIDMAVASTLMSMGMLMLPPIMISLPIKLLVFVLVDGWHLLSRALVQGFM